MVINVERMAKIEIQTEEEIKQVHAMACMAQSYMKEHPPTDDRLIIGVGAVHRDPVVVDDLTATIEYFIRETS
jgi:hypothetical protein